MGDFKFVKQIPTPQENSRLSGIVVGAIVIGALYFGRVVFMPLALAFLFSLILTPMVAWLEKLKLPRILAVFLVSVALVGLVGLLGWKTSQQVVELSSQLPTYKKTLQDKIHALQRSNGQTLNKASDTVKELSNEMRAVATGSSSQSEPKKAPEAPGSSKSRPLAVEVVSPTQLVESVESLLGPLGTAGVVIIFTVFILADRENLRNRLIRLGGGGRLNTMTQALDEATQRINRFMLLQLAVNSGYGLLIFTALHFIGVPNASLWGVTVTVLRFLPYIGPVMAAAMPIILSLAVFPGWGHALATAGLFLLLELIVGNFVEPLLYGAHLGLSPLAILVAAAFWTLIWGLPGLVLSTPLTVCLLVTGRYVPSLGFLDVLLGDAPVLPPHTLYYQRLLAGDQSEARQILEQYLKDKSLEELYDSVVIPALNLAEQDRHRGELDDATQTFIYQSTREIVDELTDNSPEPPGEKASENSSEPRRIATEDRGLIDVLCIPARDEADDVVAMLLARLLERRGRRARSIAIGTAAEMLLQVAEAHPAIVCISALPPFAFSHASALYLKLRTQSPDMQIVVCLWQFEGDSQKAVKQLKLAGRYGFFTNLAQVLEAIGSRAQTAPVPAELS